MHTNTHRKKPQLETSPTGLSNSGPTARYLEISPGKGNGIHRLPKWKPGVEIRDGPENRSQTPTGHFYICIYM